MISEVVHRAGYDLSSWQGIAKILADARTKMKQEEYQHFYDTVTAYSRSRGTDSEKLQAIERVVSSWHGEANTAPKKESESRHVQNSEPTPVVQEIKEAMADTIKESEITHLITRDEARARIAEIKHDIHETIGNPVALVGAMGPLGKEYMQALLKATRATMGGAGGGLVSAMKSLEDSYEKLRTVALRSDDGEEDGETETQVQKEESMPIHQEPREQIHHEEKEISVQAEMPVPPKDIEKDDEQKKVIAIEERELEVIETPLEETHNAPIVQPSSIHEEVDQQGVAQEEYFEHEQEPTIEPIAPIPVMLETVVVEEEIPQEKYIEQQEEKQVTKSEEKQEPVSPHHDLPEMEEQVILPETTMIAKQNRKKPTFTVSDEIPQEHEVIEQPHEDEVASLKRKLEELEQKLAQPKPDISSDVSLEKETVKKDETPQEEIPQKVAEVIEQKPVSAPITPRPIHTIPTHQIKSEKEKEYESESVTDGLRSLLLSWDIFRGGILSGKERGIQHPLYETMKLLPMSDVLAGRFPEAKTGVVISVNDYVNAWRFEQGIEYNPMEMFEHYLRRVIHRILSRAGEF